MQKQNFISLNFVPVVHMSSYTQLPNTLEHTITDFHEV